jgi:hypothetical protein
VKVIAKFMGFYNHQRQRPGEEFELDEPGHFSEKWMERVPEEPIEEAPVKKTKGKAKADASQSGGEVI